MKNYKSTNIRNVAVVGHGKTGKTSLLDACLFNTEAVKRLGSVEDNTSALDYEPEETKRGMTINLKLAACEWRDFKLNFIDTPGYPDFVGEVKDAMAAADSALIVISASSGIKSGTENAWYYAEENELPRAFFINKMDREHADFDGVVEELRVRFGDGVVPVQLPIGKEAAFQGVVDLLSLHMKIVTHDKEVIKDDVPEYMTAEVEQARQKMIEAISEFNDELLEKYIEGADITEVEIAAALIEGIQAGKIFPVFCGSAKQNIGMRKLMNGIVEYMPTPYFKVSIGLDPVSGELKERHTEDAFSAQVFKTIVDPFVGRQSYIRILSGDMRGDASYYHPNKENEERIGTLFTLQGKAQHNLNQVAAGDIVVTTKLQQVKTGDTLCDKSDAIQYEPIAYPEAMLEMAASAHKKGEEDKVFGALAKQQDEDPTLLVTKNKETGETLVRGVGEVHLEIMAEKLQRKFGAEIELSKPRVPYRETIRQSVKVQGRHKKQSGGHGQFGDVWLEIGPREAGSGNEFTETIFGGSVPKQYIPAVEKGTAETLAQGVLAGYPVVDVKVNLYDGSYHPVDSSEAAFKTAAALAIRKGVMEAKPILLEPIETIKVLTPEYYLGDVMGRLNSKRAHVLGVDSKERDMSEIQALIPLAELYKFATDLRSLTQGRGSYQLEFARYEPVPEKAAADIIAEAQEH
ncbi:elongation factor G [Selenomonas sp. GACV-9]|uniref:elongation factor G n=1 Tax=Selenomonas sp. GACV-9 TaxID=3158782 RepID=UPI0008E4B48B|nr:elongation factor G [Selenomonas ruminantium]